VQDAVLNPTEAELEEMERIILAEREQRIQESLDDIPVLSFERALASDPEDHQPEYSFQEAIEALQAAPPIEVEPPEPLRLTRQAARRMAIQMCWQRLSAPDEAGRKMPRAQRRELMFKKGHRLFNFSDLARGLMGLQSP
jgi:hypothetical protein